jgi:hypothetical protein
MCSLEGFQEWRSNCIKAQSINNRKLRLGAVVPATGWGRKQRYRQTRPNGDRIVTRLALGIAAIRENPAHVNG